MERGTVGVERYNSYHIGSNPDLKIRSPVKNELHIDSFSNGTKENDKKRDIIISPVLKEIRAQTSSGVP